MRRLRSADETTEVFLGFATIGPGKVGNVSRKGKSAAVPCNTRITNARQESQRRTALSKMTKEMLNKLLPSTKPNNLTLRRIEYTNKIRKY